MAEPAPIDGLLALPDRSVPRFEVYFARETASPTPGLVRGLLIDEEAERAEIARLDASIYRAGATALEPRPKLGQLLPLAGPYGEKAGEQTNDVLSITFTERLDALASVSIDLLNVYDSQAQRYRYTDPPAGQEQPILDFGDTLAVRFGYGADLAWVFEGVITTLDVSFPADGESHVSLTATDRRDRLRNQKPAKPRRFSKGTTEEQIAAQVAGEYGLFVAARPGQSTTVNDAVQEMPDQDALQFLTDRAQRAALELSCFGNTLFLRKPADDARAALAYAYRRGLTSFHPTLNAAGKATEVRVIARDPLTARTWTADCNPARLRAQQLAPPAGLTVLDTFASRGQAGPRREIVTNYLARSQDEAQRIADGMLKRNLDEALTVSGDLIGDPTVRIGRTLLIQNVGRFSGRYYVTSTTHRLGSNGYQTSFDGRRNTALGENGLANG